VDHCSNLWPVLFPTAAQLTVYYLYSNIIQLNFLNSPTKVNPFFPSRLGSKAVVKLISETEFRMLESVIYYYLFMFNCSLVDTRWQQYSTHWVDTRWQQYSTHLHTNSRLHTIQRTEHALGSAGHTPSLRVIPWHLPYNGGKSTDKPVRVVEKCPDIPVYI
jgi:hypothetical protein